MREFVVILLTWCISGDAYKKATYRRERMRANEERPSWEGEAEFDREPVGLRELVSGKDEGAKGFVDDEGEEDGKEDDEELGEGAVPAAETGIE